MEQIQNDLRANGAAKNVLAKRRAVEKFAKHPQIALDSEIKPTEEQVVKGGSMETRLKRVIGKGKRKGAGTLQITHSGEGLTGAGATGASNGVMKGGAYGEGISLAKHLEKLHGAGWLSDFWEGFKSVIKPVAGIASVLPGPIGTVGRVASGLMGSGATRRRGRPKKMPVEMEEKMEGEGFISNLGIPVISNIAGLFGLGKGRRGRPRKMTGGAGGGTTSLPPAGREVEHNVADSQLAPNTRAPVAYGNPPQPSTGFQKNTVGMGMGKMSGCATGGAKKKRAPSARNMLISKLMRGQGMSLAQASRYLKEHPEG